MSQAVQLPGVNRDFDTFLRAPIARGGDGTFVSVLSGFARLDIDPWLEAAELATLPIAAATARMSTLMSALADGKSACIDSAIQATTLIALLPRRRVTNLKSQAISHAISVSDPRVSLSSVMAVIFVIVLMGSLGAQYLLTHSAAKSHAAQAAQLRMVPPK
jgi:hypothetical protein